LSELHLPFFIKSQNINLIIKGLREDEAEVHQENAATHRSIYWLSKGYRLFFLELQEIK